MNAKGAIKQALDFNLYALKMLLGDLSDADLLVRPVPGANHFAWQLGHLVSSEAMLLKQVPGAQVPELPAGFAQQHDKAAAAVDPPSGFLKKDEYLALYDKVRQNTLAALDKVSETDLDKPITGDLARLCPNVGALLLLAASHPMMHSGQVTVVRRKLGKPVLF